MKQFVNAFDHRWLLWKRIIVIIKSGKFRNSSFPNSFWQYHESVVLSCYDQLCWTLLGAIDLQNSLSLKFTFDFPFLRCWKQAKQSKLTIITYTNKQQDNDFSICSCSFIGHHMIFQMMIRLFSQKIFWLLSYPAYCWPKLRNYETNKNPRRHPAEKQGAFRTERWCHFQEMYAIFFVVLFRPWHF